MDFSTTNRHSSINKIVIATFLRHTSHKFQSFDFAVHSSFKRYYNQAVESWLKTNPAVAECVGQGYVRAFTFSNITSAFKKEEIYPLDRGVLTDDNCLPINIIDHPAPNLVETPSGVCKNKRDNLS